MKKDIFVVDDDPDYLFTIGDSIDEEELGFNPVSFEKPSTAILELKKRELTEFPLAYLVDMRIPPELEGSEKFYYYLLSKGQIENFYFMTSALSAHDRQVVKRTGAEVILKEDLFEKLPEIIRNLLPEK